jgi:putative ABC transport system substrate-binding protein
MTAIIFFSIAILFSLAAPELRAQPAQVGILVPEMGRSQSQAQKGLAHELSALGYQARKDIIFEVRDARGDRNALQAAAADLMRKKVRLLFATGTSAARAAMAASGDVPVIFVHPGDPETAGLFNGAKGRPANVTGVAAYAAETTETRARLLKEILPNLNKIHVFFDANNAFARENFTMVELAGKKLGVQVLARGVKSTDELKAGMSGLAGEPDAAIFHIPDDLVESEAEFVFESARKKKLPTMFNEEKWAIAGAMAAHGPDYLQMGRQAGQLAAQILQGRAARELPVQRAAKFILTLNYRTANAIGVRLSPEMIKRADRVIR